MWRVTERVIDNEMFVLYKKEHKWKEKAAETSTEWKFE